MDSMFPVESNNTWNCIFDLEEKTPSKTFIDDDLGFDPFEETNKALAEDIKIEQKQQQMRHQQYHQHNQHLQQQQQQQHQHQQQEQLRAGFKIGYRLLQSWKPVSCQITSTWF